MRGELEKYPEVSFIDSLSFHDFLGEIIRNYEEKYRELTGEESALPAAAPERLQLYSCAVMIYQGFQYLDRAGKCNLLKYSTGSFLDNLAAMKKVKRNPAKAARTILKFTLSRQQDYGVTIPIGIRAKVNELFFATEESGTIDPGGNEIELPAVCLTLGEAGNGYTAGTITTLVDPINYIQSVSNVSDTSGGADQESDDELASRVYLAPSGYSTAGPEDAYRFWIQTYSQAIEDCYIVSEKPGEVDIYIIYHHGQIPDEGQLKGLQKYLDEDNRKPLTDLVKVKAPEENEYEIEVVYYISDSERNNENNIKKRVELACQEFQEWQGAVIGRDVNPSQLMYMLIDAGACYAIIKKPEFEEIHTASISVAKSVKLEYGGLKDARVI